MSVCICPVCDGGGITSPQQKKAVDAFLRNLGWPAKLLSECGWSLYELRVMAEKGNTLESIQEVVPFRGGPCTRTTRCCSVCTRRCNHRCIQDCLTRLYMWSQIVNNTPESERGRLPLNMRMIVAQKFDSWEQLSFAVGEMISKKTNPALRGYSYAEHPQKFNYEPVIEIDECTGKRRVNPITGELHILKWPKSGLCPYCLPTTSIGGYVLRELRRKERKERADSFGST